MGFHTVDAVAGGAYIRCCHLCEDFMAVPCELKGKAWLHRLDTGGRSSRKLNHFDEGTFTLFSGFWLHLICLEVPPRRRTVKSRKIFEAKRTPNSRDTLPAALDSVIEHPQEGSLGRSRFHACRRSMKTSWITRMTTRIPTWRTRFSWTRRRRKRSLGCSQICCSRTCDVIHRSRSQLLQPMLPEHGESAR